MGLFSLAFLDQNLFISSLAVVPIGAALYRERTEDSEECRHLSNSSICTHTQKHRNILSVEDIVLRSGQTDTLTDQRSKRKTKTRNNVLEFGIDLSQS